MRIFAISDVHVDFDRNARWVENLSRQDFLNDVLILAGDVSDDLRLLHRCVSGLATRFRRLLFVPGNHDLWVARFDREMTSLDKFERVLRVVEESGGSTRRYDGRGISIVPLFSWYDYSFGAPSEALKAAWTDFVACRWPDGMSTQDVAAGFLARNQPALAAEKPPGTRITFSHFLPRGDLLPTPFPPAGVDLRPVLGAARLDAQVRALGADVHVHGHSHLNRDVRIDGVTYVNNALGYPREAAFAATALRCIHEAPDA